MYFPLKKYKQTMKPNGIRWDKDVNGKIVDICGPYDGIIIYQTARYLISPSWCKCIKVGDDK